MASQKCRFRISRAAGGRGKSLTAQAPFAEAVERSRSIHYDGDLFAVMITCSYVILTLDFSHQITQLRCGTEPDSHPFISCEIRRHCSRACNGPPFNVMALISVSLRLTMSSGLDRQNKGDALAPPYLVNPASQQ